MVDVIIFPGQGCQIVGMGREFYDNFRVARDVLDEVDGVLEKKLTKIIFDGPPEELTMTNNTQPAIMAVSMAILRSLEFECGLSFEKLCGFTAGHSLGEYTALCASESLTLGAAAELLRIRGEAFREVGMASHGSMAVFGAPLNLVEEIVGESVMAGEVLEITNDNTDDQVVLSGSENSVDRALELARSKGISRVKKLSVSGAFHSKLMEPAVDIMRGALESVKIGRPVVGVMANYSAEPENADEIRGNLLRQITNRVRWRETMLNLEKLGVDRFIEIGPGRVLTNMVRKTCPKATALSISSPEGMREFLGTL